MPAARIRIEESPRGVEAVTAAPYRLSDNVFWLPEVTAELRPGPAYMDRSDENRGVLSPMPNIIESFDPTGVMTLRAYPNEMIPLILMAGMEVVSGYPKAGAGTNEVQALTATGTITGGTWTITLPAGIGGGGTTGPIPYNATPAVVQAFLERLPAVRPGDIVVGGGPFPATPLTLTFQGQYAATDVASVTVTTVGLTGTTPGITPSTTTPGVPGANTDPDGKGIPTGATLWQFQPRANPVPITGEITLDYGSPYVYGSGFVVTGMAMDAAGMLSVDITGLWVDRLLTDPALSPSFSAESVLPLMARDLSAAWLPNGGGVANFSWRLENGVEKPPDRTKATLGWPGAIYLTGFPSVTGDVDSTIFDQDDWDAMLDARTFAMTQRWRSPSKIGSTGANYGMWLDTPGAQVTGGGPESLGARRRHGASWSWAARHNQSSGYSFRLSLLTAVSAAMTFS